MMPNFSDLKNLHLILASQLTRWVSPFSQLFIRLLVAKVFLMSGLSKWNGFFDFDENKYDLFMYEFFCPDPVRPHAVQLCDSETLEYVDGSAVVSFIHGLAVSAGIMEVLLSSLLIVGLFSRAAALGLIGMTLFIQLAVFPSWDHWWNPAVWWFTALLCVFAYGPGKLSIDRMLGLER
tara:strand:- start:79520 stop:80053 length:534 start_codon:yes stop_codon:yes gene_type:complete